MVDWRGQPEEHQDHRLSVGNGRKARQGPGHPQSSSVSTASSTRDDEMSHVTGRDDDREFPQGDFAAGHDAAPSKSSAQLKREVPWEHEFKRELYECQSLTMLEKFGARLDEDCRQGRLEREIPSYGTGTDGQQKDHIISQMSPENLAVLPVKDTLQASLRQSTQRPLDDDFPGDR